MIHNKIIIVVLVFFLLGCSTTFEKKDLYVDKLVYLKKDSTLFTGTLKVVDNASSYYMNFCEGVPCGEHAEQEKNAGPFVSKGKYLVVEETLSDSTRKIMLSDTVIIDYWQGGGDLPSDPYYLTINILKENTFFEADTSRYESYMNQLAISVANDTKGLQHDYLKIRFVDAVHDWSKEYSKGYKLENGKLSPAVLDQ